MLFFHSPDLFTALRARTAAKRPPCLSASFGAACRRFFRAPVFARAPQYNFYYKELFGPCKARKCDLCPEKRGKGLRGEVPGV
jgi:hypothetical protein